MSYLWSDKITDYYYSNPELDTVAVMWTDPEDGLTREHYIKVDETDEVSTLNISEGFQIIFLFPNPNSLTKFANFPLLSSVAKGTLGWAWVLSVISKNIPSICIN